MKDLEQQRPAYQSRSLMKKPGPTSPQLKGKTQIRSMIEKNKKLNADIQQNQLSNYIFKGGISEQEQGDLNTQLMRHRAMKAIKGIKSLRSLELTKP